MRHLTNRLLRGTMLSAAALLVVAASVPAPALAQQSGVVAKVNGRAVTEQDVRLAEVEIGSELGQIDPSMRRRFLVEYVIENTLFAEAAEAQKLATGPAYEERLAYWRRRALRDTYVDVGVKGTIPEAEAKAIYDKQIGGMKVEEEVKARHILVDTEQKAKEVHTKLTGGGNFDQLAKEASKDPGSREKGGDLGYFGRGQMVPQFEEAAFKLKKGETSAPVQSQFGWHIIRIDDRRSKEPPKYEEVKERILASLAQRKLQEVGMDLRGKAKLEYLDPELKKQVDEEAQGQQAPGQQPKKQ